MSHVYFGRLNGMMFVEIEIDQTRKCVTVDGLASGWFVDLRATQIGMAEFEQVDVVHSIPHR